MVHALQSGCMARGGLGCCDSFPERHIEDEDDDVAASPATYSSPRASATPPPWASRVRSESPDGYEMRLRYSEAADILRLEIEESKKPPVVWDYTYDIIRLPPSGTIKTQAIRSLAHLPIRRAWRRRSDTRKPDLQQPKVVEAMMTYERGDIIDSERACGRCNAGQGASRACVVVSEVPTGGCSNCLYDGVGDQCDTGKAIVQIQARDAADARSSRPDYMAVLSLIQQTRRTERPNRIIGDPMERAKQIEDAALEIARAAREWRLREEKRNSRSPPCS